MKNNQVETVRGMMKDQKDENIKMVVTKEALKTNATKILKEIVREEKISPKVINKIMYSGKAEVHRGIGFTSCDLNDMEFINPISEDPKPSELIYSALECGWVSSSDEVDLLVSEIFNKTEEIKRMEVNQFIAFSYTIAYLKDACKESPPKGWKIKAFAKMAERMLNRSGKLANIKRCHAESVQLICASMRKGLKEDKIEENRWFMIMKGIMDKAERCKEGAGDKKTEKILEVINSILPLDGKEISDEESRKILGLIDSLPGVTED